MWGKLYCVIIGGLIGSIVTHLCHQRRLNQRLQQLEAEANRLRQESGWMEVALADKGVRVSEFLAQARQRAEFIPNWKPDSKMTWWARLAFVMMSLSALLAPAAALQ